MHTLSACLFLFVILFVSSLPCHLGIVSFAFLALVVYFLFIMKTYVRISSYLNISEKFAFHIMSKEFKAFIESKNKEQIKEISANLINGK